MRLTDKQARDVLTDLEAKGMARDEACINAILDQTLKAVRFEDSGKDTYHNARVILAEYVKGVS